VTPPRSGERQGDAERAPPTLRDLPPPYGTVAFDCDSTLSAMEGIEELARGNAEIAALTQQAMEGRIALEEVYGRRLEIVRPGRAAVEALGGRYVERLLPNAERVVRALRSLEKRVLIVSGGLLPAVRALGAALGLPEECVVAVAVRFDREGRYAGFDRTSPLARGGGKIEVLRGLRRPGERLALVGDGATDLEAAPEADRFVAFGGVERRAGVLAAARVRCLDPDFRSLAPHLLSPEEIATLARARDFLPLFSTPRADPAPPTA
jgi:phosphoserine phosphatase